MNEFEIIEKYFAPLSRDGLKDDTAVLKIPPGHDLIVTSDTLNEGTHFPVGEAPEFIAHKALRVNLSDLAAAGAAPLAYQLNIAFPQRPSPEWLEKFTGALAADQREFGIFCSGGDTTSINGPLSISITAMGLVPAGEGLRRSGARPDDAVVLTGPVGDAFIGLEIVRGKLNPAEREAFLRAYRKPEPQIKIAPSVRKFARAAADISDGLLADLGHICEASGLSAIVDLEKIPFSAGARRLLAEGAVTAGQLLSGGDDYQLVLAVAPENLPHLSFSHHVIGRFASGEPRVAVLDESGGDVSFSEHGWQHFHS